MSANLCERHQLYLFNGSCPMCEHPAKGIAVLEPEADGHVCDVEDVNDWTPLVVTLCILAAVVLGYLLHR